MRLNKHSSKGKQWYSYGPLDDLGIFTNWTSTRADGFDLASQNADPQINSNHSVANELFAGGGKIYLPTQVHSTNVHILSSPSESSMRADAVIVRDAGLPIGVLTADCLPIILADPKNRSAAVIHAGRMGVFLNIIGKTVDLMDAGNITAVIGPSIRKCCYEVKEDVFKEEFDYYRKYFTGGKLDLARAAVDQLASAGVDPKDIHDCEVCTSCRMDEFYSHRGEKGNAGRFMTGVMISI